VGNNLRSEHFARLAKQQDAVWRRRVHDQPRVFVRHKLAHALEYRDRNLRVVEPDLNALCHHTDVVGVQPIKHERERRLGCHRLKNPTHVPERADEHLAHLQQRCVTAQGGMRGA
jgi:hypothetical protein